ncbi:hypothetical protein N7537_004545 [Penicillium hordei]|uniref:Uncharacterized protein n=1 Tax=Penicillium hordei TaxID=40994 RepID=A0AAD6EBR8_9EURO|nr:uncharacterized protein N7537_004545 [Penicillium hordei]KAJ5607926.1 hypothetical protein N7537_004545 [Penicillium hordei]
MNDNGYEPDILANVLFPGKSIPALMLVGSWNTPRLLMAIGLSILLSLVVTAAGTAAGQNVRIRLTAGSYTFGVSIFIATLTLFSAVILVDSQD